LERLEPYEVKVSRTVLKGGSGGNVASPTWRYYDPSVGRFVSEDPAHHGRNWYGYAADSPTSRVDRGGTDDEGLAGELTGMAGEESLDAGIELPEDELAVEELSEELGEDVYEDTGNAGRGSQGFRGTNQRKVLEKFKNQLKRKLSDNQLSIFKEMIETAKVGEQYMSKEELLEIFKYVLDNVR
jgi:uncharacterized protein RhaS with RHS repeats